MRTRARRLWRRRLLTTSASLAAVLLAVLSGLPDWFRPGGRAHLSASSGWSTGVMIDDLGTGIDRMAAGDSEDLAALRKAADVYAFRAPLNTSLQALRADLALRAGDVPDAKAKLEIALKLDRTNVLAIRNSAMLTNAEGNFAKTITFLDPLFRRNPVWISEFQVVVGMIIQSIEGRAALIRHLARSPPWLDRFFYQAATQEPNLDGLSKLVLDMRGKDVRGFDELSSFVMRKLIHKKRYAKALRLRAFTMTQADLELDGYIFNARLSVRPANRPFGWHFRSNSAVSIDWQADRPSDGYLKLEFRGSPLKLVYVQQNLRLPQGNYRLSIEQSARGLVLSDALRWTISCVSPSMHIATLPLKTGNYINHRMRLDFRIGKKECELHSLRLETDRRHKGDVGRNIGRLLVHGFSLSRRAPPGSG